MGDVKSKEFLKAQAERRELVQLAVEELTEKTGKPPTCKDIERELGLYHKTIARDWDYLHGQGRLPERPGKLYDLRIRTPRQSLGTEGGGSLLQAEGLLREVLAEIAKASPEYLDMSREFWITRLEECSRIIEDAIARAVGTTVDDFIGQIRKEER